MASRKEALFEKYKYQFSVIKDIPYGFDVNAGWLGIIDRMCEELDKVLCDYERENFFFTDIKQKFG